MPDVDYTVGPESIERFKIEAEQYGIKVSYRNRTDKQYITVKLSEHGQKRIIEQLAVKSGIDYPFMTSGGGCNYTFRINPEPRIRAHLDDMRARGIR